MNILAKLLVLVKHYNRDIFLGMCLLLVAGIGYNIGQMSTHHETTTSVSQDTNIYHAIESSTPSKAIVKATTPPNPRVVVSKNSKSKVYHYTWCSGAKQIKEENKIWFETAAVAEAAGYSLAGNCN